MAHHCHTPAAWSSVAVAFVRFVVGSIALMRDPVTLTLLWIGLALAALRLPLFLVMAKLGLHADCR